MTDQISLFLFDLLVRRSDSDVSRSTPKAMLCTVQKLSSSLERLRLRMCNVCDFSACHREHDSSRESAPLFVLWVSFVA